MGVRPGRSRGTRLRPFGRGLATAALLWIVLGAATSAHPLAAGQARPTEPTLEYLANMGVLLTGTATTIAIDAFHHGALEAYAPLRAEDRASLEGATGRHARVDAILVTHRHLDHFQAASVAARLAADAATQLLAPREVIDSVVAFAPALRGSPRVRALAGGEVVTVGEATVRALDLPHNPTRTPRAQNLGYVVTLDGVRLLHVGDADPDPERLRAAIGPRRGLDFAVVPYWYLVPGSPALMDAIGAGRFLAAHVPLSDTAAIQRRLSQRSGGPEVRLLGTRGQRLPLRSR